MTTSRKYRIRMFMFTFSLLLGASSSASGPASPRVILIVLRWASLPRSIVPKLTSEGFISKGTLTEPSHVSAGLGFLASFVVTLTVLVNLPLRLRVVEMLNLTCSVSPGAIVRSA